jgi:osmoprotectant transport system permease protein
MFNFIFTHQSEVLEKCFEHISLSLTAVFFACLIGIPIGFLIVNRPKLSTIVLNCANIIQTIPSLAMFAFAIPIFGIGSKPAVVALFLYALLPILKNTLLGIKNVDPSVIKAATGMGMSKKQILFMVEVPLSISIIMGGVRIATVTSIGLTTIATLIAAGGLGDFIYQGLSNFNQPMILSGAFLSALLAIIADFCLGKLENKLTSNGLKDESKQIKKRGPKNKRATNIITLVIIVLVVFSLIISNIDRDEEEPIVIVHKNYTEQRLLGEAIGQYLNYEGYNTEVKELGGTMLCFNSLISGDADMYPEYTSTIYTSILNYKDVLSPEETYEIVKEGLNTDYDMMSTGLLVFNDTYVISVTAETAKKYNLEKISDLAPYASEMTIGGDSEFCVRELDGYPALENKYGFSFEDYKSMDQGLTYQALVNGKIDVNASFATDGRLAKYKLVNLTDDKNVFPAFTCFPLMKNEFAEKHPGIVKALSKLNGVLSDEDMQKYNLMVDEGEDVKKVAALMLEEKNLISN